MRMWMVNPELLCRKHLLGEHFELHMLTGAIAKGISLAGYIEKGLVEVHSIIPRHTDLASEMSNRGYNHNSRLKMSLPLINCQNFGKVDKNNSIRELLARCPGCRLRIKRKED